MFYFNPRFWQQDLAAAAVSQWQHLHFSGSTICLHHQSQATTTVVPPKSQPFPIFTASPGHLEISLEKINICTQVIWEPFFFLLYQFKILRTGSPSKWFLVNSAGTDLEAREGEQYTLKWFFGLNNPPYWTITKVWLQLVVMNHFAVPILCKL